MYSRELSKSRKHNVKWSLDGKGKGILCHNRVSVVYDQLEVHNCTGSNFLRSEVKLNEMRAFLHRLSCSQTKCTGSKFLKNRWPCILLNRNIVRAFPLIINDPGQKNGNIILFIDYS